MLPASLPLKDYFSKLADTKVDVLSSINQRRGANKGKEAARSTFSPTRKLYSFEVHLLVAEKFSRLLKRGYISLLCSGAQKYISEVKLDLDDDGPGAKEHKECLRSPSFNIRPRWRASCKILEREFAAQK